MYTKPENKVNIMQYNVIQGGIPCIQRINICKQHEIPCNTMRKPL